MSLSAKTYLICGAIFLIAIFQIWAAESTISIWRYAAAALMLGLFYEWLSSRGSSLSARLSDTTALRLGRTESIHVVFSNLTDRPTRITWIASLPTSVQASNKHFTTRLAPGGLCEERLRVVPRELGTIQWPGLYTSVVGPLGLASWHRTLRLDTQLQVVPDLLGPHASATGDTRSGTKATNIGQGLELHHLREYTPGDARQAIDWKASAKRNRPMTRVYQEEQHVEVVLVLDVGRTSRTYINNLSQFSHYVNLVMKFTQHASAQGDHVGLVVAADRPMAVLPPQTGQQAMSRVRSALINAAPKAVETDLLSAASAVTRICRQRSLVIVLTDLYGLSLDGNFGQSIRLWQSRHLPMVVGLVGEDILQLQHASADTEAEAYLHLAGSEYVQSLNATRRGASRLGANALLSRPQELQARVFDQYALLKKQRRI